MEGNKIWLFFFFFGKLPNFFRYLLKRPGQQEAEKAMNYRLWLQIIETLVECRAHLSNWQVAADGAAAAQSVLSQKNGKDLK